MGTVAVPIAAVGDRVEDVHQIIHLHRFGNEVIVPDQMGLLVRLLLGDEAGEEDDRYGLGDLVRFQFFGELGAIHHRHLDVQQDNMRPELLRPGEGHCAFGADHHLKNPRGLQMLPHQGAEFFLVINDQNLLHPSHILSKRLPHLKYGWEGMKRGEAVQMCH